MNPDEPVLVARIARAHGVRGGLLLDLETDRAEALLRPGRRLRVVEGPPGLGRITVRTARPHGRRWLLEVEEVGDRTEAERIRGRGLTVARGELPEPEPGEYLLHDLIGLALVEEGAELGRVSDVYDLPAGPMLEVSVGEKRVLVPFTEDLVEIVDLEAGALHMRLPKGLLDL